MTDLRYARRPIRDLVQILQFRATFGRPCYLKRNTQYAALIVPQYTNGPDGSYAYLKTFQRATVDEAVLLGYVVLGDRLVDLPAFSTASTHWCAEPAHQGRTITLPALRCTRCRGEDGPFTPADLCEACDRPMPLDGIA